MIHLTPKQAMAKLLLDGTSQRIDTRSCEALLAEKQGLRTLLHRFDMVYRSIEASNGTTQA